MRVEPFSKDSVVHVIKRGTRGMEIVRDTADRWRFARTLYILNDQHQDTDWTRNRCDLGLFARPENWPERKPLVSIIGWTLMPNHFHLILSEKQDGGISKFMQRLGGSMSTYFNEKYQTQGSIFQGSYKSRTVDDDAYLRYLLSYVLVKNVFELYPGGLKKAKVNFEDAWNWAGKYPFSSFLTASQGAASPIIDLPKFQSLGLPGKNFKQTSNDMLIAFCEKKESDLLPTVLQLE